MDIKMGIGRAFGISKNLNSPLFTYKEKISAIKTMLDAPTHNSFTKKECLDVCRFLLRFVPLGNNDE